MDVCDSGIVQTKHNTGDLGENSERTNTTTPRTTNTTTAEKTTRQITAHTGYQWQTAAGGRTGKNHHAKTDGQEYTQSGSRHVSDLSAGGNDRQSFYYFLIIVKYSYSFVKNKSCCYWLKYSRDLIRRDPQAVRRIL